MTGKIVRRSSRIVVTAVAAWCIGAIGPALPAPGQAANPAAPPAAGAPPAEPLVIPASDVPQLEQTLFDPASSPAQREQAARRLVSRATPEARQAIRRALTDIGFADGQLAAARAITADPDPDPALIDPLFVILAESGRRPLVEAAARALGSYKSNPEVLPRLITLLERSRSEATRLAVVRTIGTFVDKRAAAALVELLGRGNDDPELLRATDDALVYLTGLTRNSRNPAAWQQWWQQNAPLSEADFRSQVLVGRAARFDRTRSAYEELSDEVLRLLGAQYAAAPPDTKADFVLRVLRSEQPAVRAAGAELVANDFRVSGVVAPQVRTQLRMLIGDADPGVRRNVARALRDINDAGSLVPLLTQLRQETEPAVRSALAGAIAPIRDPRSIPILLQMLDDPDVEAASAAASAIGDMGALILENPQQREQVLARLRETLDRRTSSAPSARDALPLREAILSALAQMRDPSVAPLFARVLNARPRESVRARRAALKGLGELGPNYATIIAEHLDADEPAVRLEAVQSLTKTANGFEFSEALRRRLDPAIEPDASVRTEAWRGLLTLVPFASRPQLAAWVDRFRDEPDRQRLILQRLADLAQREGDADELASRRQQIADTYMRHRLPADAAPLYLQALDYSISANAPTAVLLTRTEAAIDAMLAARQYPEAATLASRMIQLNPGEFVTSMGGKLALEAERLSRADELDAGRRLIAAARTITPPLPGRILGRLNDTAVEIDRRIEQRNANPTTTPRP